MVERLEVDETSVLKTSNIPTPRLLFLSYGWRTYRGSRVIPRFGKEWAEGVYRMEVSGSRDGSSGALAVPGVYKGKARPSRTNAA